MNNYFNYNLIASDLTKATKQVAKNSVVLRDTKYYLANIGNVKSADDLLKNDRLFGYVMKAFGLSDMIYAKGLIKQVFQGGITSTSALANRLADPRYKALATAFNFAKYGNLTTTFSSTKDSVVTQYNRQTLEENAGQQSDGVRLALYFQRKASTVTSSYGILGDAALLKVVQTAFDITLSSTGNIDAEARQIDSKLKVADLQNPKKVTALLQRFTTMYDLASGSSAPVLDFTGQTSQQGVGLDLVMSLQNLRTGG